MHILTIADPETCLAFALAGIAVSPAHTTNDAADALKKARQQDDVGLVLITERLARAIRDEVDMTVYEMRKPLVLEIPNIDGPLTHRPSARDMLVSIMGA